MTALFTPTEGILAVLALLAAGVVVALSLLAAGSRHVREDRERAEQDPQPPAPFDPYGLVYVDGVSDLVHGPCASMHNPCRHCAPILAGRQR
jgi:hypothetical protein